MSEVTLGIFGPIGHGRGFSELAAVPGPAANAGFTYTVEGGYWERLTALSFRLVTDANAANRQVLLTFAGGDGVAFTAIPAASVQAASLTYDYFFLPTITAPGTVVSLSQLAPLFGGVLQPQFTVTVTIGAKQVGDQVSNIRVYRERFITGPGGLGIGDTDIESAALHGAQVIADELA